MFSKLLIVLFFVAASFAGHAADMSKGAGDSGKGLHLVLRLAPTKTAVVEESAPADVVPAVPAPVVPKSYQWSEVTAPILSELYEGMTGHPLEDGFRATNGVISNRAGFSRLLSGPGTWYELVERCVTGRNTAVVERHHFLTDMAIDVAILFGLLPSDGDDRGNPDIRSRHVANWMKERNGIDVDQAKGLLERLGYKPVIKVSKGKRKINL